jgi:hypothetical protein
MYMMEHYHEVGEHASILTQGVVSGYIPCVVLV